MLSIGSLFSGIGGFELGLERAGLGPTAFQVEIDPWCRRVLAKHWPGVPQHEDVRTVGAHNLPRVGVLCGGFPCQDVSSAGARAGLAGQRSGLWFQYLRIVEELRPRFVIVENVASGKKLWLKTVREGLGSLGYGTRAFALSAFDVGAPHLRRRVFVIAADPDRLILREQSGRRGGAHGEGAALSPRDGIAGNVGGPAHAHGHTDREGESARGEHEEVAGVRCLATHPSAWASPPVFRGVDDGVPGRVDGDRTRRLKALGNAVVPEMAETIGRIVQGMNL